MANARYQAQNSLWSKLQSDAACWEGLKLRMDASSLTKYVQELLEASDYFLTNSGVNDDFYIRRGNLMQSVEGKVYSEFLSLKDEIANFPKRISESHNKYCGKLISAEDLSHFKHEELVLRIRFEKLQTKMAAFKSKNSAVIHTVGAELSQLDKEFQRNRQRHLKLEKIYESYLSKVSLLSVVSFRIDFESQTYLIVPSDYSQALPIKCISPESPIGKRILGQERGFTSEIQITEDKKIKILVENFGFPEKEIFLLLLEKISDSNPDYQNVAPSVNFSKDGRWRDHGREDDIIVVCPICGPHPLYHHNLGCNR